MIYLIFYSAVPKSLTLYNCVWGTESAPKEIKQESPKNIFFDHSRQILHASALGPNSAPSHPNSAPYTPLLEIFFLKKHLEYYDCEYIFLKDYMSK
jgi:hypothetical protein